MQASLTHPSSTPKSLTDQKLNNICHFFSRVDRAFSSVEVAESAWAIAGNPKIGNGKLSVQQVNALFVRLMVI